MTAGKFHATSSCATCLPYQKWRRFGQFVFPQKQTRRSRTDTASLASRIAHQVPKLASRCRHVNCWLRSSAVPLRRCALLRRRPSLTATTLHPATRSLTRSLGHSGASYRAGRMLLPTRPQRSKPAVARIPIGRTSLPAVAIRESGASTPGSLSQRVGCKRLAAALLECCPVMYVVLSHHCGSARHGCV
jgi:hypothetical protein